MFIHGPTFGSSWPAEAPTSSNGVPMPMLSANNAPEPRATSPVWLMNVSAPMSGGATQVVTISAVSAPMTAVPMNVPPFWRFAMFASRVWIAAGICSSNRPNMPSASTTNMPANSVMSHGFWNSA